MAPTAPFRFLRSAAVAGSTLFLAGSAHVAVGGQLPTFPLLAALTALTLLACMLLSRWKLTMPGMLAILAVSQFALHKAFELLSTPAPATSAAASGQAVTGHQHGVLTSLTSLGNSQLIDVQLAAAATPEHLGGTAMFLTHFAATALTALLLARGEATLWALAAWLRPLIQSAQAIPSIPRIRLNSAPRVIDAALPERYLSAQRWRGPPSNWPFPRPKFS